MAKKVRVTRTIVTNSVTALCTETKKCECCNVTKVLSGIYKTPESQLKMMAELIKTETPDIVPVQIVSVEAQKTLYAMDEDKFIAAAEIIPARKKKSDESTTDETVTVQA